MQMSVVGPATINIKKRRIEQADDDTESDADDKEVDDVGINEDDQNNDNDDNSTTEDNFDGTIGNTDDNSDTDVCNPDVKSTVTIVKRECSSGAQEVEDAIKKYEKQKHDKFLLRDLKLQQLEDALHIKLKKIASEKANLFRKRWDYLPNVFRWLRIAEMLESKLTIGITCMELRQLRQGPPKEIRHLFRDQLFIKKIELTAYERGVSVDKADVKEIQWNDDDPLWSVDHHTYINDSPVLEFLCENEGEFQNEMSVMRTGKSRNKAKSVLWRLRCMNVYLITNNKNVSLQLSNPCRYQVASTSTLAITDPWMTLSMKSSYKRRKL